MSVVVLEVGLLPEQPRPGVERVLMRLFRLYQRHRPQCNETENLHALLITCSRTAQEVAEMTALLRREFLPYCYRVAALKGVSSPAGASPSPSSSASAAMAPAAGARGGAVNTYRVRNAPAAVASAAVPAAANAGGRRREGERPVYNICNGVIREQDFEQALAVNARVVRLFQDQMNRAQACACAVGDAASGKRGGLEEEQAEPQVQQGEGKEGLRRTEAGSILRNLLPRKIKKPL